MWPRHEPYSSGQLVIKDSRFLPPEGSELLLLLSLIHGDPSRGQSVPLTHGWWEAELLLLLFRIISPTKRGWLVPLEVITLFLVQCGIPHSVDQVGKTEWDCRMQGETPVGEDPNYCELADRLWKDTLWEVDTPYMAIVGANEPWKCRHLESRGLWLGLHIQVMSWAKGSKYEMIWLGKPQK